MNSRYKNYIKWISCVIFFFYLNLALTQSPSYKQFTEEDGLPSLTTYEIVQDSSGILWIRTSNGLVSYDGDKFEKYLFEEFQDNDILQVFIHETGDVGFINLANEVGLISSTKTQKFIPQQKSSADLIELFEHQNKNFFAQRVHFSDSLKLIGGYLKLENGIAYNDSLLNVTKLRKSLKRCAVDLDNKIPRIINFSLQPDSKIGKYADISINKKSHLRRVGYIIHSITDEFMKSKNSYELSFFKKYKERYLFLKKNKLYSYDTLSSSQILLSDEFNYQYLFIDRENILWASTQTNGLIRFDNFNSQLKTIDRYEKEIIDIKKTNNAFLITTFDNAILLDDKLNNKNELVFRNKTKSIARAVNQEFIIVNGQEIVLTKNLTFSAPIMIRKGVIKDIIKIYLGPQVV